MKEKRKGYIWGIIICIIILGILLFLSINDIYIQIVTPKIGNILIANIAFLIFFYCMIKLTKDRVIKGVFVFLLVFFLVILNAYDILFPKSYTTFTSPEGVKFVVSEPNNGRIFKVSNSNLFMKEVATFYLHEVYKPFKNGEYIVEWIEPNECKIRYLFSTTSVDEYGSKRYTEITFKY